MKHLFCCCAALTLALTGQSQVPRGKAAARDVPDQAISESQITFRSPIPIKGIVATDTVELPIKCTADSTAFLNRLVSGAGDFSVAAVHGESGVVIDGSAIPD